MKTKWFRRTGAVAQAGAVALVTAALVFSVASRVGGRPGTRLGKVLLTSATDFSISSTVSSSSTTKTAAVELAPGVERYLWYTVSNPLHAAITVDAMSIVLPVTAPAGCPASNLDLSHTTFSGSLNVPAAVGTTPGTASVEAGAISLAEAGADQDGCQDATFNFTYTGSGTYAEVYDTSTGVVSSLNPSTVGQAVAYTATVTGVQGSGQDPMPNSPTGTVTFKDGATAICSSVAVASASATTSTAQCSPPAYAAIGTHPITAVYSNTDGNFSGSTSSVLNQIVKYGTTTALTSAPNPSIGGTSVALTATVTKASGSGTPTGTVSFFSGTPSGVHTLLGTGPLGGSAQATYATSSLPAGTDSVYAVYGGDASFAASTSPVGSQLVIALPAACSGTFNLIVGNPVSPTITGTSAADFIYAVGANYTINGGQGNDCVQAGDGNNTITEGNGDDVILAGNGTNTITAGNGADTITAGNGADTITAGNGGDVVTLGTGANNHVTLGNGANTVTITTPGNHDTITVGNGKNTAYLGGGTYNTFNAGGKASYNTCHLPSLPASTYHDTLTNCTAVTP